MRKPPIQVLCQSIPMPPSVNRLWGNKGKGKYLMPAQKAYRQKVSWLLRGRKFNTQERYSVRIEMREKHKRRWDIDNRIKPILDVLEFAGVIHDDGAIDQLVVNRTEAIAKGSAVVTVCVL